MIDLLQLPATGGLHSDPGLREGLQHIGGQIRPDPSAEGVGHLVRELREATRFAAARVPLAEEFVQQLPVHVRAPRQPDRCISAATSIPADSAAVSSRILPGCSALSWRRSCSA